MDRFAASQITPFRVEPFYMPEQTEIEENITRIYTLVSEMAFSGPSLTKDWSPCLIPRNT
jgi:hypothetical protein